MLFVPRSGVWDGGKLQNEFTELLKNAKSIVSYRNWD